MAGTAGAAGTTLDNLPYVPLYEFNQSNIPTGGSSLTQDLNIYYESGNIAWMIAATALVLLMIPGVGYVSLIPSRISLT